jgi:hypothetical protein
LSLIWEEVEEGMTRALVPGGWIIRQYDRKYSERTLRWGLVLIGTFFIPDEKHLWNINEKEN